MPTSPPALDPTWPAQPSEHQDSRTHPKGRQTQTIRLRLLLSYWGKGGSGCPLDAQPLGRRMALFSGGWVLRSQVLCSSHNSQDEDPDLRAFPGPYNIQDDPRKTQQLCSSPTPTPRCLRGWGGVGGGGAESEELP